VSNATLAGAIKYTIEQLGLGVAGYRDLAPPKASMPFAVIVEGVAWTVVPTGDTDIAGELWVREQVQVDIYQGLRSQDGTRTEVIGLEDQVCAALHQSRLPSWTNVVSGVRVLTRSSVVDDNVRRTIVTLEIDRTLATPAA
jgi:hypothetical protein